MMKYLFFIIRSAAFFIDYIFFYIILMLFSPRGIIGYIIALVFLFLYRTLTTALFGATFGMMIFKYKLVRYDFKICLKREVYRFASAPLFLGYLYAFFDEGGRTLHDIVSGTYISYSKNMNIKDNRKKYIIIISNILLVISIARWTTSFVLNDIGLIGLKKLYTSDLYYQSFDGDNITSLSQDELYMKTMGRRYTTVIDINGKPSLIRISNKLTYTEVYKLTANGKSLTGEFLFKVNLPLQFICSGKFNGNRMLCGVSPTNKIIFTDSKGTILGNSKISVLNILTLGCGDIDMDGVDEAVVMGRGGDMEIYRYSLGKMKRIYSGKIGEDIVPETFYVGNGIVVVGISGEKRIFHYYNFKDGKFKLKEKKYSNINNITSFSRIGEDILVSHVYRNNMVFKTGKIQRLERYSFRERVKRIYNFGSRPGRKYSYYVRTLEGIYDINGDGVNEIVLKAVNKDDVMGHGYIIEVYKEDSKFLFINKFLSFLEDILYI